MPRRRQERISGGGGRPNSPTIAGARRELRRVGVVTSSSDRLPPWPLLMSRRRLRRRVRPARALRLRPAHGQRTIIATSHLTLPAGRPCLPNEPRALNGTQYKRKHIYILGNFFEFVISIIVTFASSRVLR